MSHSRSYWNYWLSRAVRYQHALHHKSTVVLMGLLNAESQYSLVDGVTVASTQSILPAGAKMVRHICKGLFTNEDDPAELRVTCNQESRPPGTSPNLGPDYVVIGNHAIAMR